MINIIHDINLLCYRKIPKISPEAYIFRRPFFEGLIFGEAYLWREICVSKSIGLAFQLEGNLPFLLCFTLYLRAISKYKPLGRGRGGAYIWRGDLTEVFLRYEFEGLIFEGAYTWRGLFAEFSRYIAGNFSQQRALSLVTSRSHDI